MAYQIEKKDFLGQLTEIKGKYKEEDYPLVSIVIPTTNNAQSIALTLESVLQQDYPSFEVIIVDCSTDRTIDIIQNYHNNKIRIYHVSKSIRYEMLNKGLSQAQGKYINFLFPGDFYIYPQVLRLMMTMALNYQSPDLVYCGSLLRDGGGEVKILYRDLTIEGLKRGQQPTSLQSCWFLTQTLIELGKFNSHYSQRGGFDLMCRFHLNPKLRYSSVNRVLTDYDLRMVTRTMIWIHFWETMKTINHYFGFLTMLRWLFLYQKDIKRYFKVWSRSLKTAFSGR